MLPPCHIHPDEGWWWHTGKQLISKGHDSHVYKILSHSKPPRKGLSWQIQKEYKNIPPKVLEFYHVIQNTLATQWPREVDLPARIESESGTYYRSPIEYADMTYTKLQFRILPLDISCIGLHNAISISRPDTIEWINATEIYRHLLWSRKDDLPLAQFINTYLQATSPSWLMSLATDENISCVVPLNCMLDFQGDTLKVEITDIGQNISLLMFRVSELMEDYIRLWSLEAALLSNELPMTDNAQEIMDSLMPTYLEARKDLLKLEI